MYNYNDVAFDVVKNLDTNKINESFRRLYQNDKEIFPSHDFTPKVWENRWFNNETIIGYPVGYCVWRNVYNEVSSFLEMYGELVYNYSQQNEMLQNIIVSSWEEVKNTYIKDGRVSEGYQIWKDRYYNAISGYSKETQTNITKNSQITYLKIEITDVGNDNPSIAEINELSIYTDDNQFIFNNHNPFFETNGNILAGELKNIVDRNENTSCKLQTKDKKKITKENPIDVVIELGSDFLNLRTFQNWKLKFNKHVISFNLYCSENGEEWAYLAQVEKNSTLEPQDKIRLRNTSYRKQYLQQMFDYGPYYVSEAQQKRIELYISKINDNKSYLSDSNAWQSLVLSDENSFSAFISTEIDTIFNAHMKDYHLDGNLSRNEVDQLLLRNDLSNFDVEEVQNKIEVKAHDQFLNSDGFDYVVDYKRGPITEDIVEGKKTNIYRWYRLWNSGLLEHGGIVKCKPIKSVSQNVRSSYISVNLNWDRDNPVYNYDEISSLNYGNQYEQLYYGNKENSTIEWKEIIKPNSGYLGKSRYMISLTPVIFNDRDINSTTFKYNDISCLSSYSYPEQPLNNKNQSYLVNEVHHIKNDSFCFTRSDTNNLDGSKIQYYQYYTIGYKADWKKYDYDLTNVTILNLNETYQWREGEEIKPDITVVSIFKRTLIKDKDYKIEYANNANPGIGIITIIGIGKYFNQRICTFKIEREKDNL